MSTYILPFIERKKLANGAELINTKVYEQKKLEDVTIWKTDSKGVEFPNFDNLKEGDTIEANFWRNPTSGKASLYPVKEKGTYKPKKDIVEKTSESVAKAQDRNEISYKISGTARDATLITTALMTKGEAGDWRETWMEVRAWLWNAHEAKDSDFPPFNK